MQRTSKTNKPIKIRTIKYPVELEEVLTEAAEEREWSITHLIRAILQDWCDSYRELH